MEDSDVGFAVALAGHQVIRQHHVVDSDVAEYGNAKISTIRE